MGWGLGDERNTQEDGETQKNHEYIIKPIISPPLMQGTSLEMTWSRGRTHLADTADHRLEQYVSGEHP